MPSKVKFAPVFERRNPQPLSKSNKMERHVRKFDAVVHPAFELIRKHAEFVAERTLPRKEINELLSQGKQKIL